MDLDPGFTVLTGETGAGKTLVVDALELVRGSDMRLDSSLMSAFSVAALFDDGLRELSMGRELSDAKRLRATIDGQVASADAMARMAEGLFTIHGQRTTTRAASRQWQRDVVDTFGSVVTYDLWELKQRRSELQVRLGSALDDPHLREREVEMLQFHLHEFESLAITDEAELEASVRELEDLTRHREATGAIAAASELLALEGGPVEVIAGVIPSLPRNELTAEIRQSVTTAVELLRDAGASLRSLIDDDGNLEERLAHLESRVDELTRFVRKHGGSLPSAIAAMESARRRLDELMASDEDVAAAREELALLDEQMSTVESRVRHDRQRAAQQFAASVTDVLPRVALPHARVLVDVAGNDGGEVEFRYQPHHSAVAGPLVEMASGGELSRVMLALTLVSLSDNAVAIFDEVDAGIGGSTAQSIGDCLAALARQQQVIAVTHTASIAAKANSHWVVEKSVDGTSATVRQVTGSQREREIARMLSGDSQSPESLALARQLLG